jgi:hypothetical protein
MQQTLVGKGFIQEINVTEISVTEMFLSRRLPSSDVIKVNVSRQKAALPTNAIYEADEQLRRPAINATDQREALFHISYRTYLPSAS